MVLSAYAMPGAEISYDDTRAEIEQVASYAFPMQSPVLTCPRLLRLRYAMSSTDKVYATTRSTVEEGT